MSFSVINYVRDQSELPRSQPRSNTMREVLVPAVSCSEDFLGSEDSYYANYEVIHGRARNPEKMSQHQRIAERPEKDFV